MKKLNQRKIRWIVKVMKNRELTVCQIARQQGITPRHARRVFEKYKDAARPRLLSCGRKSEPITKQDVRTILALYKQHPFGAVNLEKILQAQGRCMSHNRIHKILVQEGLGQPDLKKQKRRNWIRWERKHSNSLWHIDYSEIDGKQVLGLLDDASRLIPGYGEFEHATAENAVRVLDKAVQKYGTPKQLLSDNGSHFASVIRKTCLDPEQNIFQKRLNELGIQHIKARIHHPQTNGKLERWFYTVKQLKNHFGTLQKAVNYYNHKRPNMSLEKSGQLITPIQAFTNKA